jgi:hypothetical protein
MWQQELQDTEMRRYIEGAGGKDQAKCCRDEEFYPPVWSAAFRAEGLIFDYFRLKAVLQTSNKESNAPTYKRELCC